MRFSWGEHEWNFQDYHYYHEMQVMGVWILHQTPGVWLDIAPTFGEI